MNVIQTRGFRTKINKLTKNQKKELDMAIHTIYSNPDIGQEKKGDLAGIQVYKLKMNKQLTLLAYQYNVDLDTLTLLALGSHENFYRNLT
jgi:mRNA-degrading endonuclease RelE of RelBE toxin-antitoxin system